MHPLARLREKFAENFSGNTNQLDIFFSPGRLCLIGEHIDYNGGLVLPAAISYGIHGVFRKNESDILTMRSTLSESEVQLNLRVEIPYSEDRGWGNYPAGVIQYLKKSGCSIPGGELLFDSNLPAGVGLSSSASIEALTAFIFLSMQKSDIDKVEMARLCKQVENEFVGVQCGIMDQFAVILGKKNHALLLDCNSLEYEEIPVDLGEYAIVIFNTNKKRALTESMFNQRVTECNEALKAIQAHREIQHLAESNERDVMDFVQNPVARKRALHVVQENKRVKDAAFALKNGDIEKFGSLLFLSHESLKEQYEVTGRELDAIVTAARNHSSCIGAKMSGAGFGGCAFGIVIKENVNDFATQVLEAYRVETGIEASCYFTEMEDGVRRV